MGKKKENTTTKIVCLSDTHGSHGNLRLNRWLKNNPAEIFLFAGDYQYNSYDNGEDFIEWLSNLPYKHKVIVPGNHDGNFDIIREKCKNYDNIHFIIHNSIKIEGIKFFCSAYSRTFGDWWFMESEDVLEYLYEKIPEDINVLITHTPPFGVLDQTVHGILAGSTSLNHRINKLPNIKYNIFGHIHENFGEIKIEKVKYINCSIVDEKYYPKNLPVIFEYDKD